MKICQFEEIIFWLSLIACLLAYNAQIEWLTNILAVISIINFICLIVTAWRDIKRNSSK
nr:MAG TPA: YoqO-like protein [Caudoviricetes sp.]